MPIRRIDIEANPVIAAAAEHTFQFAIEPFLLGGGAVTRKHDPCAPVRPSSVLGHVRWFWRLQHPELDADALREREAACFGAASKPAPFAIDVRSGGVNVTPRLVPKMTEDGGYLLFAGREERKEGRVTVQAAELSTGVTATVRIVGTMDHSVVRAFRLWALLGGVGARTRRGIGAVQVAGGPSSPDALVGALRGLIAPSPPSSARGFRGVWLGAKEFASAEQCLYGLERWYKSYRQDRRQGSRSRFGRSYWDEPELIRAATGARSREHQPLPQTTRHAPGWARAVLGLPIVFKFKDDRAGDPELSQLQGKPPLDRFASPLLFRPVRLAETRYVPVVARLVAPYVPEGGLCLRVGRESFPVELTLEPERVFSDLLPGLGGSPPNPLALAKIV